MVTKRHTDRAYEGELERLREDLLSMAGLIEQMINDAVTSLCTGDLLLAQRTIDADAAVNSLEVAIDEACLLLLAKRQPLACDLRMITFALKVVTDLERIGDLAKNIGERVLAIGAPLEASSADRLQRMAQLASAMIRESVDAFVAGDGQRAREVFGQDQEVDDAYREFALDMQQSMARESSHVVRGIHLQACAKFLERIGDHATNLAELVIFQIEGTDLRHTPGRGRQAL